MDADPWADAPASPPHGASAGASAPTSPSFAAPKLSPVKPTPPETKATPVKSSSVNVKAMISQLNAGAGSQSADEPGFKGKGGKKGKGEAKGKGKAPEAAAAVDAAVDADKENENENKKDVEAEKEVPKATSPTPAAEPELVGQVKTPTPEPVEPVAVEAVEPAQSPEPVASPATPEPEPTAQRTPTPTPPASPPSTSPTAGSPSKLAAFDAFDDDDGDIGAVSSPVPPVVSSPIKPSLESPLGSPVKSPLASPKTASPIASPPLASPTRSPSPDKSASPTKSASPAPYPVKSVSEAQPDPAPAAADPYSFTSSPVDTFGSNAFGGDEFGGDAFDDTSFAAGDISASLAVRAPSFGADELDPFAPSSSPFATLASPESTSPSAFVPAQALSPPPPPATDEFVDDGFSDAAFDGGDDGFGDFDDFEAPAATFEDDGFGDFGEFEEGEEDTPAVEETPPPPAPPAPVVDWIALSLRPVPPRGELLSRITVVLEQLVASSEHFTDEPPRAVGGLAQVLATESSRDTYAQLTTAPMLKPLDWTRSRVRRDHLISMGVPVNLDEVDSHRLSTLPPLQITTSFPRSQSVDPERLQRGGTGVGMGVAAARTDNGPASAGPALGGADSERKYGLGARPSLDITFAEELCGLDEEQLSLLPLAKLEALHADFAAQTADASALLAWFLQLKDAQTQDSATYNGMISEMISNAAKVKGGSTGGGLFRRNSQKPAGSKSRPASLSANATPRRVGSPGVF